MKLFLLLVLLGTVSALHLRDNAPLPDYLDDQADLSQNLDSSREKKGELALHGEEIPSGEEEAEASDCQDTFEDKDNLDSDAAAPGNFECHKEEDTVPVQINPERQNRRYILVKLPRTFSESQETCKRCYGGNLVSIHDINTNNRLRSLASKINRGQVWIGVSISQWYQCNRYTWADGSRWDYSHWAAGQPGSGTGNCVTLCTPDYLDNQADLSQNLDSSGEKKGELALHGEEIPSGEEEAKASDFQDTFEDKDDLDSDLAASWNVECPKKEDIVQEDVNPHKEPRQYILVRSPKTFSASQVDKEIDSWA
ncbi:proteoglycan 3-like [Sorex fumeus]|uniref:proteoglycan 3-like n=1 Tax=Sorex fumeus TaxID=62283 RepID=UPI0024ACA29F|nr:proteoglycan 3-like [Sorex fumeus]